MKNIIVFASGSGTNAESIIRYFANHPFARVSAVFTNNAKAGVIARATQNQVPVVVFTKSQFESGELLQTVLHFKPAFLVLAGFLWKIPEPFLVAFPNKIINIHPALLPKYGGKGMYGIHVHQAVLDQNETETGITIHLVNEHYDEGEMLFQAKTSITECGSAQEIANKVQQLEQQHFSAVIESYISQHIDPR